MTQGERLDGIEPDQEQGELALEAIGRLLAIHLIDECQVPDVDDQDIERPLPVALRLKFHATTEPTHAQERGERIVLEEVDGAVGLAHLGE